MPIPFRKSCETNRGLWRSAGYSGPVGRDVNVNIASLYCMAMRPIAILEHERKRGARGTRLIDGETQASDQNLRLACLANAAGFDVCDLMIARDGP
jgi:hypothetical protein